MGADETRRDVTVKRIQLTIGILVGVVTLVVGMYNANTPPLREERAGRGRGGGMMGSWAARR